MELVDRPAVQSSAADLAEEVKSRSAPDAAAKLASFSGLEIAAALMPTTTPNNSWNAKSDVARLASARPVVSSKVNMTACFSPVTILQRGGASIRRPSPRVGMKSRLGIATAADRGLTCPVDSTSSTATF